MTHGHNRPYYSLNNEQLRTRVEIISNASAKRLALEDSHRAFSLPFANITFSLTLSTVMSTASARAGKSKGPYMLALVRQLALSRRNVPRGKERKELKERPKRRRSERGKGTESNVLSHPRLRTSVNKRRDIFLTRSFGIAANEVFKYLNTKIYVEGTCMNYA